MFSRIVIKNQVYIPNLDAKLKQLKHLKHLELSETYSETITASPCPSGMIA